MGKSNASCFKFIACGSNSVDHDDLQSKDSIDRRGWSFRKRSVRHTVLSTTVGTETPSSTNKENTDTTVINFLVQPDLNVPDKNLITNGIEDKAELSSQLDSKLLEDEFGDATYNESSVIKIQAAIRGFLARKALLKQKNIIKLQAAVRGHVVRRYAVGTLHCIQAIVKMQALIRSHHASLVAEEGFEKGNIGSSLLGRRLHGRYTYVSTEKLLSNAFARQLLESVPRPTNIKCQPSKSDTAWKWLERWSSVSSVTNEEPKESGFIQQHTEEHSDCRQSTSVPSEYYNEPTDSSSSVAASIESSKNDYESGNIEIRETDFIDEIRRKSLHKEEEEIRECNGPDSIRSSTDKVETEGKKVSRKASNPAFIAAQSKFEELSSAVAPVKSLDKLSSAADLPLRSRDDGLADNSFSNASAIQFGDSECGTVLSITSTLDSPEVSEAGVNDIELETSDTRHQRSSGSVECEANRNSMISESDWSCSNATKLEQEESTNSAAGEWTNSMNAVNSGTKPPPYPEDKSSPKPHITDPVSQATPSSEVSVKPKKKKGEKSGSNQHNKSLPVVKNSVSKDSLEPLHEHKTGKKRHPIGSEKSDHGEPEPRDCNLNNLPSYMQVTESARAKAISNGSPRSSPDVHDKEIHVKKRHSLPSSNDRQRSPRIQNAKGNATLSPQDRKWRR
ncbi:protein IQ-DOMAIN 32-like isoform X2 [Andrographis paniculata]|uniref:protein IQ-DOMAIN 32-like isoform X2 n=1 Tax=Andrographis paniculata TaxID=175694 RepID=UPI0021E8B7E0|nr:protein IQ-DOMAIN 32-like isoform X2 [Andrographis paniculata]